jgi:two-component system OmpR family response regulator
VTTVQANPGANKTIFVVDDDIDVLEQITMALKVDGYTVLPANSQSEAEDLMLSTRPDLAIVDLMMEEKDSGLVLCNSLKRLYNALPVIIVSNMTPTTGMDLSPRSPEERSWVKADLLMNKPVVPERLRAEVRRLINQGHHAAAAH